MMGKSGFVLPKIDTKSTLAKAPTAQNSSERLENAIRGIGCAQSARHSTGLTSIESTTPTNLIGHIVTTTKIPPF